MSQTRSLLLTRPDFDRTTRYVSAWAGEVIDFAKTKGSKFFDLAGERAKIVVFESMLKKQQPDLIFLNGHGGTDCVSGQDYEILVKKGVNEHILSGKIVYALSCSSGKELGPASIKAGAKAYIGYSEEFVFIFDEHQRTHPGQDNLGQAFSEPSNQVMISLLKGHTPREAYVASKKSYIRSIQKLVTSRTPKKETAAIKYLLWNLRHLSINEQVV